MRKTVRGQSGSLRAGEARKAPSGEGAQRPTQRRCVRAPCCSCAAALHPSPPPPVGVDSGVDERGCRSFLLLLSLTCDSDPLLLFQFWRRSRPSREQRAEPSLEAAARRLPMQSCPTPPTPNEQSTTPRPPHPRNCNRSIVGVQGKGKSVCPSPPVSILLVFQVAGF